MAEIHNDIRISYDIYLLILILKYNGHAHCTDESDNTNHYIIHTYIQIILRSVCSSEYRA